MLPAEPLGILTTRPHYPVDLFMPGPSTTTSPLYSTPAEKMLACWLRGYPDALAVKSLTPCIKEDLLEVLQQILSQAEGVNVDHEDVWEMLAGACTLQFSTATACGPARAQVVSRQAWTSTTTLGSSEGPVKRVLVAVHGGSASDLNADELAEILALATSSAEVEAEIVFGHGCDARLGKSIRVMLLISRY